MVFFAGHGEYDEAFTDGTYLIPYDAERESTSRWIDHDKIRRYFGSIKASHILLISDSCFSGGAFRMVDMDEPSVEDAYATKAINKFSRQVITSGGMERVQDGGFAGHSVFSHFLISTLESTTSKFLTPQHLFDEIKDAVTGNSQQVPDVGRLTNAGDDRGFFCLVNQDAEVVVPQIDDEDDIDDIDDLGENDQHKDAGNTAPNRWRIYAGLAIFVTIISIFAFINSDSDQDALTLEPELSAEKCDRLAASSEFPGVKKKEHVPLLKIPRLQAVEACSQALKEDPENTRLAFQKARALLAAFYETSSSDSWRKFSEFATTHCQEENGESCALLGKELSEGSSGQADNSSQAFKLFERACDLGSLNGCRMLGEAYRYGRGVKQSNNKSASLFEDGCSKGHEDSCTELGLSLQNFKKRDVSEQKPGFKVIGKHQECTEITTKNHSEGVPYPMFNCFADNKFLAENYGGDPREQNFLRARINSGRWTDVIKEAKIGDLVEVVAFMHNAGKDNQELTKAKKAELFIDWTNPESFFSEIWAENLGEKSQDTYIDDMISISFDTEFLDLKPLYVAKKFKNGADSLDKISTFPSNSNYFQLKWPSYPAGYDFANAYHIFFEVGDNTSSCRVANFDKETYRAGESAIFSWETKRFNGTRLICNGAGLSKDIAMQGLKSFDMKIPSRRNKTSLTCEIKQGDNAICLRQVEVLPDFNDNEVYP